MSNFPNPPGQPPAGPPPAPQPQTIGAAPTAYVQPAPAGHTAPPGAAVAVPPGQPAQSAAGERSSGGGFMAAIGTGIGYLLFPLIWLGKLFVFRVSERQGNQVATFVSFSSMIYVWPVVLVGFVAAAIEPAGVITNTALAWTWIGVTVFVMVVLGTDINRNAALIWALVVALFLALGALVHKQYNIPVLGAIYDWFEGLNVQFSRGSAIAVASILAVVMVIVFVQALFDGRHEISSREVTHRRLLRGSESLPLTINRVRLDWPDLLEMITLFGAGHLIVVDNTGKVIMRIPNIPFLWFYRDEVNRILDIMATTEVNPAVLDNT